MEPLSIIFPLSTLFPATINLLNSAPSIAKLFETLKCNSPYKDADDIAQLLHPIKKAQQPPRYGTPTRGNMELGDLSTVERLRERDVVDDGRGEEEMAAEPQMVEEEGEGDAVVILNGDAIVREKGLLAESGDGLDVLIEEEVMEEEGMVSGEVKVSNFSHLLEGWDEHFLEYTCSIFC
ncbi:hypothetical protein Ancab_016405 [Ancistrocladus abbreviatus]